MSKEEALPGWAIVRYTEVSKTSETGLVDINKKGYEPIATLVAINTVGYPERAHLKPGDRVLISRNSIQKFTMLDGTVGGVFHVTDIKVKMS